MLEWVDGFNHQRLLEPIGDIPRQSSRRCTTKGTKARPRGSDSTKQVCEEPGAVQSAAPSGCQGLLMLRALLGDEHRQLDEGRTPQ